MKKYVCISFLVACMYYTSHAMQQGEEQQKKIIQYVYDQKFTKDTRPCLGSHELMLLAHFKNHPEMQQVVQLYADVLSKKKAHYFFFIMMKKIMELAPNMKAMFILNEYRDIRDLIKDKKKRDRALEKYMFAVFATQDFMQEDMYEDLIEILAGKGILKEYVS